MATYVNDLRLKEIATGDESGTWGTSTNTNLELIAEAFSFGTEAITTNADTHTTTIADGSTDPGRSIYLKYTGTLDSTCTITIGPNTVSKLWFIENGTSGSQNIIISQGSGANVTIPPGDVKAVYSDGAGSGAAIVDAFASLNVVDLKVEDDLTVTDDMTVGGTLGVTGVLTATSLDISGDIDVDGTTNLDVVDIDGALTQDGGAVFNEASADVDFRVESNGNANMLFVDGGNDRVGINGTGTNARGGSNTVALFDVSGSGKNYVEIQGATDSTANGLLFSDGSSGNYGVLGYDHANDVMNFFTASSERMRIDSSGRILIGTTSSSGSSVRLEAHDATNPIIQVKDTTSNIICGIQAGNAEAVIRCPQDSPLVFNVGASETERMRIDSSGKVGIGETSPSKLLHIASDTNYEGIQIKGAGHKQLTIESTSSSKQVLTTFTSASQNMSIGLDTDDAFIFHSGTASSERMRINSSGQVLIGTTSALQSDNKLSISGSGTGAGNAIMDIRNTSTSDTCGCIALSKGTTTTSSANRYIWFFANNFSTSMGAIGGNGASNVQFVTASDERLKENIKPLTGSLDKVLALNPVSYTWKESGEDIKAGFVAQEVEKILPEYTATEEDEMKTKSLTGGMTAGYIAVLTKAIQEQQEQIDALQSEINELKNS
jgi:hypothetical protein